MRKIALLLAFSLAACSGSDTTAPSETTGTTGSATTVAKVFVDLPNGNTIAVGATVTAIFSAVNSSGQTLEGKNPIWTSDNTGVARVGTDGKITGVAAGTANITTTVDGVSGKATVTVK